MESGDQMRLYGETSSSSEATQGVSVSENGHPHQHHHPEAFYSVYHYQQFMPPVAVLNEGLPPPPGLSPPCGAPPGFYYPPQQPPPHLYYGQSPQLYTPVVPMPVHQQQQQSYGHFQYFPATVPPPPASPMSAGPETVLDRGDNSSNSSGVSVMKKPVIDPMIENIVGSMSMSTNGTYTPFGPSVSIASTVVGGCRLGFGESEEKEGRTQPPLLSSVVAGAVGPHKDKIGIVRPRVIGRDSGVTEKVVQRAASPKEEPGSRPQTPGKLSYSEVLTKNEPRGGTSSTPKVSSAPASNSPSPGPGTRIADQNCYFTPGATRRTSVTSLQYQSDSVCKDAFHSNSSSSSSSPVTKPKLPLNNTFETVTNKGSRNKENSSSTSSSKSSTKNTPSATPTHSTNSSTPTGLKGNKTDRRVLNVSNNQSSGSGGKVKTAPPSSSSKPARNFPFEFDIEDLDEFQDSEAKSGIKRDSVSGASTVSSSGGSKNVSANGAGYTCNPPEKKPSVVQNGKGRGGREKGERQPRNRKGGRDSCIVRRVRVLTAAWALHLISALNWLYKLIVDVGTLSCSLAFSLIEDGYNWWKANAFPSCCQQMRGCMTKLWNLWARLKSWKLRYLWRKGKPGENPEGKDTFGANRGAGGKNGLSDILSMMGPERNISLPLNGEEALKRLMSVKGQDPYSILGIRSDSSDETIRRYYKRQAVLVHPDKNMVPGAEEAFKILARAFELIGEPTKRIEYHRQLLEAHQKELVFGEIGNLLEQLRKKIESVSNSIRCTKCNSRHKKNRTDRPLFAARYCAQCRINHGAREGDLWAERTGLFGWSRSYYACMESGIWEVNEWASCQKKNLKHLLPDCHSVMYRLVAGGGNGPGGNHSSGSAPPGSTNNASNSGPCCSGGHKTSKAPPTCSHHANGWDEFGAPPPEDSVDPDLDDWDSLISNLVRNPGSGSSQQHHSKNTHGNSSSSNSGYGGPFSGSKFSGLGGGLNGASATVNSAACPPGVVNNSSTRRRGKARRK